MKVCVGEGGGYLLMKREFCNGQSDRSGLEDIGNGTDANGLPLPSHSSFGHGSTYIYQRVGRLSM